MAQNPLCPSFGEEPFINPSYFRRLRCRWGYTHNSEPFFVRIYREGEKLLGGWDEKKSFGMVSPVDGYPPGLSQPQQFPSMASCPVLWMSKWWNSNKRGYLRAFEPWNCSPSLAEKVHLWRAIFSVSELLSNFSSTQVIVSFVLGEADSSGKSPRLVVLQALPSELHGSCAFYSKSGRTNGGNIEVPEFYKRPSQVDSCSISDHRWFFWAPDLNRFWGTWISRRLFWFPWVDRFVFSWLNPR